MGWGRNFRDLTWAGMASASGIVLVSGVSDEGVEDKVLDGLPTGLEDRIAWSIVSEVIILDGGGEIDMV